MSDASDRAFNEWLIKSGQEPAYSILYAAFTAGWQARKSAQYSSIVESEPKPAFYRRAWVPPRDNPNDKRFDPRDGEKKNA